MKASVIVIALSLIVGAAGVAYWQFYGSDIERDAAQKQKKKTPDSRPSKLKDENPSISTPQRKNLNLEEKKQKLSKNSKSLWQFKIQNQKISQAIGGKIEIDSNDEKSLVETAKDFAESFDLDPSELGSTATPVGGRKLPGIQVYTIPQTYQGYPVYHSQLRVSVNNETNEIVGFNAKELKDLHSNLPTNQIPKSKLFKDLNHQYGAFSFSEVAGPYAYPDENGRARLVFEGKTGAADNYTPQTRRILVDAETGEIFDKGPIAVSDDFKDHGEQ